MTTRDGIWREIKQHPDVPVLILGGGINGIGVFRELALQGIDCLLVDKSDFTSGATSKSSRMIHGGLRYLENGEFKLVRESLAERNRLLENAPHYVSPLKTTIPLFAWLDGLIKSPMVFFRLPVKPGGRGGLIVKMGLMFYDFITRKSRRTPTHYLTGKAKSLKELPGLNPGIVATATYWDARITQAERLCIELIRDASEANPNCRALNYVGVAGAGGDSVTLRDERTGDTVTVKPKIVVNATGAWVDLANAGLGLHTHYMRGTKGSHLVVDCPALFDAIGADRMVYYEHQDGRVCIVFRFMGKVIMGSTDLYVESPDDARCDDGEIDYMMTTLRGVFPGVDVRREHIIYTFCGVRPLPAVEAGTAGRVSRDHKIELLEPANGRAFPVYSLIGGKWTTFRALAEQTADKLLPRLGASRTCSTEHIRIGGGKDFCEDDAERTQWIEAAGRERTISEERAATLLARYGTLAEQYLANASDGTETPLHSLPDYSVGEIEYLVQHEQVECLTDLICRRSVIALLGQATPEVLDELAGIVARVLGWDDARRTEEIGLAAAEVKV